jgi:two-component system copper resistance phosphate regulon response regulator CusR
MQLTYYGFKVDTAETGKEGFRKATRGSFDVIVLDIGLPDENGMIVCHNLRKFGVITPILVLSGNTSKKTIVSGLKTGADDYLEKPFYKAELLARINALIRRNQRLFTSSVLNFGGVQLDIQNSTIQTSLQPVKLTAIEVALMHTLMKYAPKTVGREELFSRVWGINDEHASNRLDVYIKRLRRKLLQLEAGTTIQTVYGKGYRLK